MTGHEKGKRQADELDASLTVLTPAEVIRYDVVPIETSYPTVFMQPLNL